MTKQELIWSDNEKEITQIHIKVKRVQNPRGVIKAHTKFERDLKSCMQCRFFYGSNNQCVAKKCVKEDLRAVSEKKKDKMCFGCPYQQREGYCFPCMKKVLEKTEKQHHTKVNREE